MTMDYEKKYKELIEKIELISHSALTVEQHQIIDTILGELTGSEDEKVRKALIEMVHDTTGDSLWIDYNVHKEDALAWLEKQGEKPSAIRWYDASLIPKEMEELLVEWDSEDATWHEIAFYHADTKTFWNGTRQVENVKRWCYIIDLLEKQGEAYTKRDVDDAWLKGMCDAKRELEKQKDTNVFDVPKISIKDAIEVTSRMQYIEDDMKPIADFVIDYASWNLHKDEWNQPVLEVPLFRVLDALIQRGKPYCECSQNIEKQSEQKPADTVELKCEESKTKVFDAPTPFEDKLYAFVLACEILVDPSKREFILEHSQEILDAAKEQIGKEQSSTWSEKDEEMRLTVLQDLQNIKESYPNVNVEPEFNWLKSLKPQNRWKPSDEQMEALKNAIHIKPFENPSDSILWGLYEQLKKLREE